MPSQAQPLPVKDFQTEAVSTGRVVFSQQSVTNWHADQDLPRFDLNAARLMRTDAEVNASVEFLVDAILSDGIQLTGAMFEEDAEFAQSEIVREFCQRALFESPQTPVLPVIKELCRGAMYFGHKVAEIILRLQTEGDDAGKYVLDKLKVKSIRATEFVVDEFFNVLGLVGIRKNQNYLTAGMVDAKDIIPVEKFVVMTLEMQDADPRGIPQVRAAFEPFVDKRETRAQFKLWRRKCAIRSIVATAPANARQMMTKFDSNGNPVMINGMPAQISTMQAIGDKLAALQSDTVAVMPDGTGITPLETSGDGKQFVAAFDFNNSEIRKAILLQTLATGEGQHMARAASETHERVLGRRVSSFRDVVADKIYDLLRLLVSLNFGDNSIHLAPKVSLGEFDKSETKDKLASAVLAGYTLDKSQFIELDSQFSFPERDPDSVEEMPEPVPAPNADEKNQQDAQGSAQPDKVKKEELKNASA